MEFSGDADPRQNDEYPLPPYPYIPEDVNNVYPEFRERDREQCSDRMENALEVVRRRQLAKERQFRLKGYTLHQPLRSAPLDMYVTDMRVRLPSAKSWVSFQFLE